MGFGSTIKVYLMDEGDSSKRIKCSIANRTILIYKIPRNSLKECKDIKELNYSGIYLLFGYDDKKDKEAVYVGQADVRKNGEALLARIQEHTRNSDEDYWNEVVAITTTDNSYGSTDINYLEHRFYELAIKANRYHVENKKDPSFGEPSLEDKDKLEEYISDAKTMIGMLGYKTFEEIKIVKNQIDNKELEFVCDKRGTYAIGARTEDGGFIVKKGSKISPTFAKSCYERVKKRRKLEEDKIDANFVLKEDIYFKTPSSASNFVVGSMTNGLITWFTNDDNHCKLKDISE